MALRDTLIERRPAPERDGDVNATLAFFEAYFSNFIEGTEFTVEEAAEIVFEGVIPQERPADAHEVLGTFRVVSYLAHLKVLPSDFTGFRDLLRRRHATQRPMPSMEPPTPSSNCVRGGVADDG